MSILERVRASATAGHVARVNSADFSEATRETSVRIVECCIVETEAGSVLCMSDPDVEPGQVRWARNHRPLDPQGELPSTDYPNAPGAA